mmetsp:Transcript_26628/g.62549  ORF Transcript_26628/g.62549 Transcript_26628/m.62549 type:complete len:93 (-) Transcript_26628:274-552(-)|eukprot:CAMPEP_0197182898 /NCGR_PEP_ID=MMETSP1423-20130617/7011_1 /TAXON_ID=476441 /ORGANISM="Pseudo-nitzschia heimii, Strain UNC1101" /LENGTH=92 /DNA_ID=CAMNT_0042633401 /DNA_START=87 /DNA_END=365 /DNA_ORIENTATION=-
MGLSTLFVGGGLGFAAQCTSNAIQKIPVSRQPWMHVLCTIGGAWAAQKWTNAKYTMLADVNELRAYKGLPPMVGSNTYFPFVPPVEEAAKKE